MADTPQTLLGSDTPASAAISPHEHHHHHPHLHHSGKRFRQFLRPDGRKVHVASSPDEANLLRKRLSAVNEKDDFDLVIHGSIEHVSLHNASSLTECGDTAAEQIPTPAD